MDIRRRVNRDVLKRMNDVIRHRGPDDEGYALISRNQVRLCSGMDSIEGLDMPSLFDIRQEEFFLGVGHRRLSILDPTIAGHQPMTMEDSSLCIVFNGEIYNYIEIREELKKQGYLFRTGCDTEVILQSYREWGIDCVKHFNGMWAFALWDEKKRFLFCSRDRLGAKPFHYHYKNGRFLFGSELKQLCQDEEMDRKLDTTFLASNMVYHISDYNERTMLAGVKSLPAGHHLLIRLSEDCTEIRSFQVLPYWKLHCRVNHNLTFDKYAAKIKEEFARSCSWRMRSDAAVGALLSGGIDSSCMVAEICSQMEDPSGLQTFTTSYPGYEDVEEWKFADQVNRHCGCRGMRYTPAPQSRKIEECFEDLIWHTEMPSSLALLGVRELLQEIRCKGYKVILNGQCGDESWLGYERYYVFYFHQLLRTGKWKSMLKELKKASIHSKLTAKDILQYYIYFNFPFVRNTRNLKNAEMYCHKKLLSHLDQEEFQSLLYPKKIEDLQYKELTGIQLPHIVHLDDRLYMAESIESRIPFMDYRMVELAVTVPVEYRIREGFTKYILRKTYENKLPKEVVWRTNKMGFGAPVNKWKKSFDRDYVLELIENAKTKELFDTAYLKKQYLMNPLSENVFRFLQTEIFARRFQASI